MTDFTLAQEDASIGQSEAWTRPAEKKYASLSREHSLALLHKLATDDGFRSRFEQGPVEALIELGVPHATIFCLKEECRMAKKLADKEVLADAWQQLCNAGAEVCIQMIIPSPSLDFGRK